ncbi:MAG: hypothetical protein IPN67_13095 [Bacteroidales bacterium]|nr:hypothetical protein [Bacteroidales bacterium]
MTDNKFDKELEKLLKGFIMMDLKDLDPAKIEGTIQGKWNSIVYITGGNGVIQIDFDEFSALENKIFFIEKYKVWNINKTNNLKGYLVQFTDIFYNHIYTGNPN